MSAIKTVSSRIQINASQAEVFRAVTSWDLQGSWIIATRSKAVGPAQGAVGDKLEAFTGFGPFGFTDSMTITKWDPPHVCEVLHTGKVVQGKGLFRVAESNGNTYFTWTEMTPIPFGIAGRAGWLIARPIVSLAMKLSLRRLKKLLEKK